MLPATQHYLRKSVSTKGDSFGFIALKAIRIPLAIYTPSITDRELLPLATATHILERIYHVHTLDGEVSAVEDIHSHWEVQPCLVLSTGTGSANTTV